MNLEEMMKPYFDKKEELESKESISKKYAEERQTINLRLDRLAQNKESEIAQYIENAVLENKDFYNGYGAMIRKDLEKAYLDREQKLKERLEIIDKLEKEEMETFDKFYNVSLREMVDIKDEIRKKLYSLKKELELSTTEIQLHLDETNLKLARYETIYDSNRKVVNGEGRRILFDEVNALIEAKYDLEKKLNKVYEYLKLTELTKEEAAAVMRSMTPWEKEEYDRRRPILVPVLEEETQEEIIEEPAEEENNKKDVEVVTSPTITEDGVYVSDNVEALIKDIFSEVIESSKKLNSIKLDGNGMYISTKSSGEEDYSEKDVLENEEGIELPNGIYLNKRDLKQALNNYYKEIKGRKYAVKVLRGTFEITKESVKKVKKMLKECSTIKLLREKKIGAFDLRRVYGKDETDKFVEIGKIDSNIPTGEYIKVNDLAYALKDLFTLKTPTWKEKFIERLTKRKEEVEEEQIYTMKR